MCTCIPRNVLHRHAKTCACRLIRVGDLVMSIPFSFPVSRNVPDTVFNTLSWSAIDAQAKGIFEIRRKQFVSLMPASRCDTVAGSTTTAIDTPEMLGVLFPSGLLIMIGVVVSVVKICPFEFYGTNRFYEAKMQQAAKAENKGKAPRGNIPRRRRAKRVPTVPPPSPTNMPIHISTHMRQHWLHKCLHKCRCSCSYTCIVYDYIQMQVLQQCLRTEIRTCLCACLYTAVHIFLSHVDIPPRQLRALW